MNQQLPNFASIIVDALGRAALPSASEPEDVAPKAGLMFVVLKSKGSDDAGDAAPCADCICSSPESLTQTEAQAPQPPEPNSTIFVYDHFLPAPLRSGPAEGDPISTCQRGKRMVWVCESGRARRSSAAPWSAARFMAAIWTPEQPS